MNEHSFEILPFRSHDGFSCNLWRLKIIAPLRVARIAAARCGCKEQ
jgi:hypothetical protein